MKKSLKKILCTLLVTVMAVLCMAVAMTASAATEGYYTYTVTGGTATITDVDTSISGEVVIPDTLGGYSVTSIGLQAFYKCTSLKSITIPDSVTSIGDYAFYGCTSLTSITIPDSVTSIGLQAFHDCTSLTSITIPDSVTSIGYSAFYNCTSLESITIPDSVTSIGGSAFYNCESLTSITIPDSVTSIGYAAFYYCTSLESITIPDSVTSIGNHAFEGCTILTSITIPDSVTSIGDFAFEDCTSLTSVTIGNGVTSIGEDAFHYTAYYNDGANWEDSVLYVGNHLIKAKTSISGDYEIKEGTKCIAEEAFYKCTSLTSITIPDSVTSIGDFAFEDCTSLTSVTIGNGVTSIGEDAFHYTAYYNDGANWEDSVLYVGNHLIKAKTSISGDYEIKEGTKCIAEEAFYKCTSLTSITIPDSVTSIGYQAFYNCTSLESVTIGNSVTSIGSSAFHNCTSLTAVYITDIAAWCNISFDSYDSNPLYYAKNLYLNGELVTDLVIPDGVTSIGSYAFYDCTSLTSITIPDSVTSKGYYAFYGCTSLTSITVDENNEYYSSDEYGVLFNKDKTELIQYPIGNTRTSYTIPDSVTSIGPYAFSDCRKLASMIIPDSVISIGYHAFYNCTSLESVTIGNSVTSIGDFAFYNCTSLTTVYITDIAAWCNIDFSNSYSNPLYYAKNLYLNGELVTDLVIPDSVTSIGYSAFYNCTCLESITIPDSVTSIGKYAFCGCTSLTIVCGKDSAAEVYAKENNINYVYGGYLSNGLKWEVKFTQLVISGDATYIPDFKPGESPWINFNEDEVRHIKVDVENLTRVGKYAFYGMTKTTLLDFKTENTIHFGKYACFGPSEYSTVYYDGTSANWENCTFDYGNDMFKNAQKICRGDGITISRTNTRTSADGLNFENFIEEHKVIAQDGLTPEVLKAGSFHNNATIDETTLIALGTWDVLGDIGKAVSFQFDGYSFQANYFDMYLSELILALNDEEKTSNLEWKVGSTYNKYYKKFMNLLKSSDEWEKSATPKIEDELTDALKGDSFELGEGTAQCLEAVFQDLYRNRKGAFTSVFEGLDTASGVLDNISDAADIANMFINAYNTYIVSKAFCEVNSDFFNVCTQAAHLLTSTPYSSYGDKFLNSVNKAKASDMSNLEVVFDVMYSFTGDAVKFAYEKVLQAAIQKTVYPAVAGVLGCAAGSVAITSFAYNCAYTVLDLGLKLGKKSEAYKAMNAIAPVEGMLRIITQTYRSNLLSNPTEANAKKFDMAYSILRQTNIYLYDTAYKYGSYVDNEFEMSEALRYKNWWSRVKCHYGYYGSSYNLFSANCPVDVYIYDTDGLLVAAVVNEEITEWREDIVISAFEGKKAFTYPTDKDYTVKIVAREEGTMNYSAAVITDLETELEVKSCDIPLETNQEFTVNMPTADEEGTQEDYQLNTNDSLVELDYSYSEACQEHSFGDWSDDAEAVKRTCTVCGFAEYKTECDHSQYEEIIAYSVVPTCQNGGHSIYVCSGCGEQTKDGEDISALECEYIAEEFEALCTESAYTKYTCIYCCDVYYDGITEDELAAAEHSYDSVTIEPTCTADGYTTYTCSVCGDTYTADKTSASGHSYESAVTAPTCTADGYTTYTCSVCGDTYTADETSASGHSYESAVTAPTCTADGYTTYTCSVCGDTYTADETSASGHSYESAVTAPTCTEEGYTTYTCSVCGDTYTADKTSASGHSYEAVVTAPTCTEEGYTTYTCSVCSDTYTADKTSASGHSYEPVVTAPTCTAEGYTTYSCKNCSYSYIDNRVSATGHKYTVEFTDNGCLADSYNTYTCACGDTYTETVSAPGHDFDGSKCKNCDYDKSEECSCNCHKTGIAAIIWKILRFFQKLFKTNPVCSCGAKHW